MDKKNKIIIVVVGLVCVTLLFVLIKFIVFPSEKNNGGANLKINRNEINIEMPKIDENLLRDKTKKALYDDAEENDYVNPFTNQSSLNNSLSLPNEEESEGVSARSNTGLKSLNAGGEANNEIQMLLELQKQIEDEQRLRLESSNQDNGLKEIKELKEQMKLQEQMYSNSIHNLPNQTPIEIKEKIVLNNSFNNNNKDLFYSTVNKENNNVLTLIPAEIVDRTLAYTGSTVAIRINKPIYIEDFRLHIPKAAVIYAKAKLINDRLELNIDSYKANNILYKINIKVYDFDGREGMNLSNKAWLKIPSKIAKEVFTYAYTRGTQAAGALGGGGNQSVNLDEAKDIAVLSALKEVSNELLERRKVLLPKQYNIWLNITNKKNN
jgi:hypothetical protein